MKQAIIDIGSNSIRLTLYETEGQSFKILFREKIMAGLAGYVEDGKLFATLSSDEFKKTAAAKKNLCGCRSNWRLEAKKSPVVPGK